jgi:predicted RNase H-like HicB family nuclease
MRPVVMQIESIDRDDGFWVRRVSFPDFPGCEADAEAMEEGINRAYRRLLAHLESTDAEDGPADVQPLRADLAPLIELYRALEQ